MSLQLENLALVQRYRMNVHMWFELHTCPVCDLRCVTGESGGRMQEGENEK